MSNLTKEMIDALVDGMPKRPRLSGDGEYEVFVGDIDHTGTWYTRAEIRAALYLAAGLTAEGERKPERVRCWQWTYKSTGVSAGFSDSEPLTRDTELTGCRVTPGWFVPDGAE